MVRRLAYAPPAELRPHAEAANGVISQNKTIPTILAIVPGAKGIKPVPKRNSLFNIVSVASGIKIKNK